MTITFPLLPTDPDGSRQIPTDPDGLAITISSQRPVFVEKTSVGTCRDPSGSVGIRRDLSGSVGICREQWKCDGHKHSSCNLLKKSQLECL